MNKEIAYIKSLLMDASPPEKLPEDLRAIEGIEQIDFIIRSLREGTYDICNGNLDETIKGTGYLVGTAKNIQATFRHLIWQIENIYSGDFSQEIQFLGDISQSLNKGAKKLESHINSLSEKEKELVELSELDHLTKIYNRRKLEEIINKETEEAKESGSKFSVCILDIDDFKLVNDNFGHLVGDEVLNKIACTVNLNIRAVDYLGRWGGEEFLVVFPNIGIDESFKIAERIRKAIEKDDYADIGKVTASFGVAEYSKDINSDDLVHKADKAMYRAKLLGKNQVCKIE